jgi:Sigma-70 region 2
VSAAWRGPPHSIGSLPRCELQRRQSTCPGSRVIRARRARVGNGGGQASVGLPPSASGPLSIAPSGSPRPGDERGRSPMGNGGAREQALVARHRRRREVLRQGADRPAPRLARLLREHDHEDAVAYLIQTCWQLSQRYDPERGWSFSKWAYNILRLRVVDWYRQRFYDQRFGPADQQLSLDAAATDDGHPRGELVAAWIGDPPPKRRLLTPASARASEAARLRETGLTWAEVAARLGYAHPGSAYAAVRRLRARAEPIGEREPKTSR